MLKTVKGYISGWLDEEDSRKKEHGSLNDWKKRSSVNKSRRYRVHKPNGLKSTSITSSAGTSRRRRSPSIWERMKNVFSADDQELREMKKAYTDFKVSDHPSPMQTRSQIQRRIANSAVLKRKLLEKQYDDKLLEELRRGRKVTRMPKRLDQANTFSSDNLLLLQSKLNALEQKLTDTEKDLRITKKRLKFAQEKNTLLESLLNDANVDDEYVKSRRRITNLQKENLKPLEGALPPSPQRAMSPLFTSSPMRFSAPLDAQQDEQDIFYNKYPKIPEAELLPTNPDDSLSPIRVDYSKYSSSRGL